MFGQALHEQLQRMDERKRQSDERLDYLLKQQAEDEARLDVTEFIRSKVLEEESWQGYYVN